jgi:putative FmdB family regulatory protein
MPIYEYHCKKCDAGFEKLVSNSRVPAPACPTCGSKKVERTLSAFSALSGGGTKESCSLGACPSGQCMGGGCMREQ